MNTNRKHAYCFFLNPLYGAHQTPLEDVCFTIYEDESEVIKTFVSTCGSKAVKYRTHEFTRQNNTNADLPASI